MTENIDYNEVVYGSIRDGKYEQAVEVLEVSTAEVVVA